MAQQKNGNWEIYHSLWILLNSLIFIYGLIVLLYVKCCNSKKLYNLISTLNIDYVISSPLRRAKDTAKLITNNEFEILIDERLRERNYGLNEGKPVDEDLTIKYWDFNLNTDINNKDPLTFTENEIQAIFDQAMINAGVNEPQLNKTNYKQNNLPNNYVIKI